MNTKPIFDYLYEIETRKSFVKYPHDVLSEVKLKSWQDYLHLLNDLKGSFEACVFQCAAENPQFKEELHVIVNKLQRWITVYENRRRDMPDMFDDSSRIALAMAKDSLKFLQENYGVDVVMTITPKPDVESEPSIPQGTDTIISGIRELARVLGVGTNKAQAIVNSKILEKDGIQWNAGTWKFNKQKLLKFIEENPTAFSKIKCTR